MYAEGMKLAKRFEEEEAELADKLKVCGGGDLGVAGGRGGREWGQGVTWGWCVYLWLTCVLVVEQCGHNSCCQLPC
jgi:hypothetical protein